MIVIAHLSDLHFGAHEPAAAASVAADVAASRPSLTVVTGDLTMRARAAQFRLAHRLLEQLPAPLLVVPGNHDVAAGAQRLFTPLRGYQRFARAFPGPAVRIPGLTALGLPSTPRWRWKNGRVTRSQADEVRATLGAAPAGTVRLLALHHPLHLTGPAGVAGRARLLRILADARVDLVLAGHTHVPRAGILDASGPRPVEVVAGTAISRRTRGAGRSWTVIRVDAGAIDVEERTHGVTGWHAGRTRSFPRPDFIRQE